MDWQSGALNKMLIAMHVLKEPIEWLQNPAVARGTVSFVLWWIWFGYTMIIFMAGIKAIPEDYLEAATVDGASKWQVFRHITLPCLKNTMIYNVITSVIGGLTMFDIPFVISNGTGQPLNKTLTMVMYVYNTTFRNYNFGYGATIGVALSVVVFICVLISFRFLNRKPL
jgi:multiple sugar transport system permease protein